MEKYTILTITGSDSTGGSGVQADIKTISALGGYAVSAITSITVQNTLGIQQFYDVPGTIVSGQIEAIINDIKLDVIKVGMIRNISTLQAVVDAIVKYEPKYVVYDPIVYSSLGEKLMTTEVIDDIRHKLLPLCSLVIIRKKDFEVVVGDNKNTNVYFLDDNGMHGMANTFSSAVALYLSKGFSIEDAITKEKSYINQQQVITSDLKGRSSELYNDFFGLIEKYHTSNSDVAFYADCLNVSSRYLAQVCKKIADKSPKAIIDDFLIDKVCSKLKTSTDTIQQVAYEFGFLSQAHFAKFFRKMKGESPSDYRKNI